MTNVNMAYNFKLYWKIWQLVVGWSGRFGGFVARLSLLPSVLRK